MSSPNRNREPVLQKKKKKKRIENLSNCQSTARPCPRKKVADTPAPAAIPCSTPRPTSACAAIVLSRRDAYCVESEFGFSRRYRERLCRNEGCGDGGGQGSGRGGLWSDGPSPGNVYQGLAGEAFNVFSCIFFLLDLSRSYIFMKIWDVDF